MKPWNAKDIVQAVGTGKFHLLIPYRIDSRRIHGEFGMHNLFKKGESSRPLILRCEGNVPIGQVEFTPILSIVL
jgi:hypothetical protein